VQTTALAEPEGPTFSGLGFSFSCAHRTGSKFVECAEMAAALPTTLVASLHDLYALPLRSQVTFGATITDITAPRQARGRQRHFYVNILMRDHTAGAGAQIAHTDASVRWASTSHRFARVAYACRCV
jgi:hypothetical protein